MASRKRGRVSDHKDDEEPCQPCSKPESLQHFSLLDIPPEHVASIIVDLFNDFGVHDSRSVDEVLRFHQGWIAHSILYASSQSQAFASETIERVIEIACCLELLCQHHTLAMAVVNSLTLDAISRLTAWTSVRSALIPKIDEIITGSLSAGLSKNTPIFRASRSRSIERWILSQPYLNESELLSKSLRVEPPNGEFVDVDARISQLEAIVEALNEPPQITDETSVVESVETPQSENTSSDLDVTSDTEEESWSSSESDFEDITADSSKTLAQQTTERVARQLYGLVEAIHLRTHDSKSLSPTISQLHNDQYRSSDTSDRRGTQKREHICQNAVQGRLTRNRSNGKEPR